MNPPEEETPDNPPDRHQEASDAALVEEHEDHPERFERVLLFDPDRMNAYRASIAERALESFAPAVFRENPQSTLIDLLCDLHHWADRNGIDFAVARSSADSHYNKETSLD